MENRPLTPPQESFGAESQPDEDIDYHEKWLRSRGIDIDAFMTKHNRLTIPIEEDIQVLIRFRQLLTDLGESLSPNEATQRFAKELQEEAEAAKKSAWTATYKYYMTELPINIHCTFLSFLRSRSSNSSDGMVHEVIPYLIDQMNASKTPLVAPSENGQMSQECTDNAETPTSAHKSVRPSGPKSRRSSYQPKRPENKTRVESSVKKSSPSRRRKSVNHGSEPVRRSSRLQKLGDLIE
ncbi:hypothetical protein FOPE_04463 [Fonsecaea pedrosoi]|nr:hypothetical protein FOPE_04463 [Fonsecaea pedrosoi]